MRFFFYGTLIDPDVRALVLGLSDVDVAPARLANWRCVFVEGRIYPVIVPRKGVATDGVVTGELDERSLARLVAYEGPEYRLNRFGVSVEGATVDAVVFTASPACRISARPWSFGDWERRHKRRVVTALRSGKPV